MNASHSPPVIFRSLCDSNMERPVYFCGPPLAQQTISVTRYLNPGGDTRWCASKDPMGREHFWFTVVPSRQADEETDRWALEKGWISITPLRLDLTNDRELEKVGGASAI